MLFDLAVVDCDCSFIQHADPSIDVLCRYVVITDHGSRFFCNRESGVSTWELPAPVVQIELNKADAQDLLVLPGVGPVLSQRIVRFREALGGFRDIDDLYDVFGLDSSVVDDAKSWVTVNATLLRPFCLDTVSFRSMLRHPRFDVETTKKLMRASGRGVHALDVVLLRGAEARSASSAQASFSKSSPMYDGCSGWSQNEPT